jgi:Xaa-Pro aminopeptidase
MEVLMDAATYTSRRHALRETVSDGLILIAGNGHAPRNYIDNYYPFRQDSHLLYYSGVDHPGLYLVLDPGGREQIYGAAEHPDDVVWLGPHPTLADHAAAAGVEHTGTSEELRERLRGARAGGEVVHFLPPYRAERKFELAELLGDDPRTVEAAVSDQLVRAVATQRSNKSDEEIAEIEAALAVTAEMYRAAMAATCPGRSEAEIAAALQGPALAKARAMAFNPIVTVHGEVLHNESYANTLADGDLLLVDSGAESPRRYASDITRTWPVSGSFSARQREVYGVVLAAQQAALDAASPARSNRDLHLIAARAIADGLVGVGLMQGDSEEAVAVGAHALFMPHGIGHMLGQDVHDMEDLGDVVGYPEGESRSTQFGLNALRLSKKLEPGFVITVEPGAYFIPALIDRWQADKRHGDFIRYDRLEAFRDFGGIRIEDDVLITEDGSRVLGPPIPKAIEDVEAAVGS